MNKNKRMPEYKTRVNGVPVTFKDVPYVEAWGSREIQINFHSRELEDKICHFLLHKRPVITGGTLKFIRLYLGHSLQQINDAFFDKTKTTMAEWEKQLDKPIPVPHALMSRIYDKLFTIYQAHMMEELLQNRQVGSKLLSESVPIQFQAGHFEELDEVES